jgi:hypothetical protein
MVIYMFSRELLARVLYAFACRELGIKQTEWGHQNLDLNVKGCTLELVKREKGVMHEPTSTHPPAPPINSEQV